MASILSWFRWSVVELSRWVLLIDLLVSEHDYRFTDSERNGVLLIDF